MGAYKMSGNDLFDSRNHKIATIRADGIYDERNHKVASIRGIDVYDERNKKVATLKGNDIYDGGNKKIGNLTDVKKMIDGALGGVSIAALWLFFCR